MRKMRVCRDNGMDKRQGRVEQSMLRQVIVPKV